MKILFMTIILSLNSLAYAEKYFIYYDFKLNESFIINATQSSISAFDYVDRIDICDKSKKIICFNTEYFSFSIPKHLNNLKVWSIDKTKYCLIKKSYDKTNDSISLIINFGYEDTCEKIKEKGHKLVFNTKFGLRYMEGRNTNGFPIKVISVNEYGFGGNFTVKTK